MYISRSLRWIIAPERVQLQQPFDEKGENKGEEAVFSVSPRPLRSLIFFDKVGKVDFV